MDSDGLVLEFTTPQAQKKQGMSNAREMLLAGKSSAGSTEHTSTPSGNRKSHIRSHIVMPATSARETPRSVKERMAKIREQKERHRQRKVAAEIKSKPKPPEPEPDVPDEATVLALKLSPRSRLAEKMSPKPKVSMLDMLSRGGANKRIWKRAAMKIFVTNTFKHRFDDDKHFQRNYTEHRRSAIVEELKVIKDSNRWLLELRWETEGHPSVFGVNKDDELIDINNEKHRSGNDTNKWKLWRSLRWTFSSFPFNLVFHLGNFGANITLETKWWDRIQVAMSAVVYMFPLLFAYGLDRTPHQNFVEICIMSYLGLVIAPVAWIAARDMKKSFDSNSIVLTSFLFRPCVYPRLTLDNLTASGGYFFEFLQHCQIACPNDYFGAIKVVNTTTAVPNITLITNSSWDEDGLVADPADSLVDSLLEMYISQFAVLFYTAFVAVAASSGVLLLRFVLRGKWNYKLRHGGIVSFLLWAYGMYFIHGPLYLTVQKFLFQGLACDYSATPATLLANPNLVCWDDDHRIMVVCAMLAIGWYTVTAILLPATSYLETTQPDLDIIFVPVYLQTIFFVKTLILFVLTFLADNDELKVAAIFVLNLLMLYLNNKMMPCCVGAVNICRGGSFSMASWIGLVGIIYQYRKKTIDTASCAVSEEDIMYSSLQYIFAGFVVVCVSIASQLRKQGKTAEHLAESTFVDFRHEDIRRAKLESDNKQFFSNPRQLQPYLALCTSLDQDHNDAAAEYHKELVNLLDQHPSQRVRFQAAWAIFVLSLHPENRNSFIDMSMTVEDSIQQNSTPKAVPTLLRKAVSGELELQFKCLAAIVNLSAVESEERMDHLMSQYGVLDMVLRVMKSDYKTAAQFSAMAVANFARFERGRLEILKLKGLDRLAVLLKSRNPLLQKAACCAVSNMMSEESVAVEAVIGKKNYFSRILRIAHADNGETVAEVSTLLANLTCYNNPAADVCAYLRKLDREKKGTGGAGQITTLFHRFKRSHLLSEAEKHMMTIALYNMQDPSTRRAAIIRRFKKAKARVVGTNLLMRMFRTSERDHNLTAESTGATSEFVDPEENEEAMLRRRKIAQMHWRKLKVWGRVAGGLEISRRRRANILERHLAEEVLKSLDIWPRLPTIWQDGIFGKLERQKLMRTMIDSIRVKNCKDGEMIFRQGEVGYSGYYYIISKGNVHVIVNKKVTRRLHARAAFGEVALLEDRENAKRTASCVSIGDCTLLLIEAGVFRECALKCKKSVSGSPVYKDPRSTLQDKTRMQAIRQECRNLDSIRARKPITRQAIVDWPAWGSKLDPFTVDSIMDQLSNDPDLPTRTFLGPM